MLGRALLLIVLIPLIELVLLNQLLEQTGLPTTVLLVLITGMVGVSLARRQGMTAWRAVHSQMAQGRSPSKEILDGVMILFAGAFLITPGILTDCVGFSLLIPQVRRFAGVRMTRWFMARTAATFKTTVWPSNMPTEDEVPDGPQPGVRVVEPEETNSESGKSD